MPHLEIRREWNEKRGETKVEACASNTTVNRLTEKDKDENHKPHEVPEEVNEEHCKANEGHLEVKEEQYAREPDANRFQAH